MGRLVVFPPLPLHAVVEFSKRNASYADGYRPTSSQPTTQNKNQKKELTLV